MHSSVDHFLDELKTWIEIETPTHDREAVNRLGALIEGTCRNEGLIVDKVAGMPGLGDTIRARSMAPNGRKGLLVLAHFDTVHPKGTLAHGLPWRVDGDRLYGPGTSDMKAWPIRTSPCGCSSPEVPSSSPEKAGSTKETAGNVPVRQRS